MKVLPSLVMIALAMLVVSPAAANVDEAWLEVQEVLSAPDGRSLQEPVEELVNAAEEIDIRRLTPFAAALVAWSESHPDAGDLALETAVRIDPELPASYFVLTSRAWQAGSYFKSVKLYLQGWIASLQNEVSRRNIVMSFGIWLILGVAAASLVTLLVMTMRTVRRSGYDAMAVGALIFKRANAIVFGLVLLMLPLFAGLGPAWLVVYLFAIGWIYLEGSQRVVAVAVCVVLAVVPVLVEGWQRALLRMPPVTERVAVMLDDRQLNPSTLREFLGLKEYLSGDPTYHLVLGELLRMHSAVESSIVEFQTAAAEPLGDPRPFVFLGNMALEDGNVQLAIQQYDAAIDTRGSTALAYHNLSSAYDLNRRFEQGDAARARARELAGGRSAALGYRGRDSRIRYPKISSDDVDELVSHLSSEERLLVGFGATEWRSVKQLLNPFSMVFWVGGIVGIVVFFVRSRWFPAGRECSKCGKVYRLEDEPGESPMYCRQCVSVFLQRDLVPIDQQTAKLAQVRRWDRWTTAVRRLVSMVAPGSYLVVGERVTLGVIIGIISWCSLVGAAVWVPRFLGVIEPTMPTLPVTVIFVVVFILFWILSIVSSWQRR